MKSASRWLNKHLPATCRSFKWLPRTSASAERAGRLFPLSLPSEGSCEIGGVLATNAGGVGVLAYGSARSLALGPEVVLAGESCNAPVCGGLLTAASRVV